MEQIAYQIADNINAVSFRKKGNIRKQNNYYAIPPIRNKFINADTVHRYVFTLLHNLKNVIIWTH